MRALGHVNDPDNDILGEMILYVLTWDIKGTVFVFGSDDVCV